MYRQTANVILEDVPKQEPIDLYVMKRGASLILAAVTSTVYKSTVLEVLPGIREIADFTKICDEHEFCLRKDNMKPKQYNLAVEVDMCDDLCTIDGYPCRPTELPDQLLDCLSG